MSETLWKVTFKVFRQKAGEKSSYQKFQLEINPDEYVLDGVEQIWAFHDRSLNFRHACHHSACGACGMRVNKRERLTCITPIREVTHDGGEITIDPLRNFTIVGDLVVDFGAFFTALDAVECEHVLPASEQPDGTGIKPSKKGFEPGTERLIDCLECGLCVSACPISATDPAYLGPASLGQAQLRWSGYGKSADLIKTVDQENGLWRCHSAYECTEVCPSFAEPAARIMNLRRMTVSHQLKNVFQKDGGK